MRIVAALGPMLREVIISEALHALGIPTTRSLAVVTTGSVVYRDTPLPGAVLTRTAASHIRIGSFQYFAARNQPAMVGKLADYCIRRHDHTLLADSVDQENDQQQRYRAFLASVIARQAKLIAQWMGVGFIHGVMNTDNMTIAGETIDYGPCAFMEAYKPDAVFSSIDHNGRYAYQNQPGIAQWNLARFAETLLPLLADDADMAVAIATEELNRFMDLYRQQWLQTMRNKLGLFEQYAEQEDDDITLINDWLNLLETQTVDFTLAFRRLSLMTKTETVSDTASSQQHFFGLFTDQSAVQSWLNRWQARCATEVTQATNRAESMDRHNPWICPRNHRVEAALTAASDAMDFTLFQDLMAALQHPFVEQPQYSALSAPADENFTARYRTFCGT